MSEKRPIYNSMGEVLYPGVSGEGGGYRGTYLLELATESWEENEAGEEWPLRCDVPLPEAKTGYTAVGALPGGYGKIAQKAGMAAYCEAGKGFVRFYAREKPPDSIRVQVTLLGDEDVEPAAGPVAGSGVNVDDTLTVAGSAADAKAVGDRLENYMGVYSLTLPADGWEACTDVPGYVHKQTAELRAAREANVPSAVPTPETFAVAVSAGLAGVCETKDGSITFWAENLPEADIQMQVSLLGQITDSSSTETDDTSALGDTTLGDVTL